MPHKTLIVNRQLLIGIIVAAFFLAGARPLPPAHAATSLETAQSDYNFNYSKFRDSQERYVNAKNSYLAFKTAASKDQAFAATKDYLNQVTALYPTYLGLVNEYGNSLSWQDSADVHTNLVKTLAEMSNYFVGQRQQINDTKTLEELSGLGAPMRDKIEKEINPQINFVIANYEVDDAKDTFATFESLSTQLGQNKQNFAKSTILANWQTEVDSIKEKAQKSLANAKSRLADIKDNKATDSDVQAIHIQVTDEKSQLKKTNPLFMEASRYF
ncbi:hypothetical protein HY024_03735 [Candidatus Curtissbacteria bacterium]|nr:hypothetical protein [Candidatus Curtissbacteria bacterium]